MRELEEGSMFSATGLARPWTRRRQDACVPSFGSGEETLADFADGAEKKMLPFQGDGAEGEGSFW